MSDTTAASFGTGLPKYLDRIGHGFKRHSHVVARDRDWRDALNPKYYDHVLRELAEGDAIEVHSFDHSARLVVHVLGVNSISGQLSLGFTPIWPPDLSLPEASEVRLHRAVYNEKTSIWSVVAPDGATVSTDLADRDAALRTAAAFDRSSAPIEDGEPVKAAPAESRGDPYVVRPAGGGQWSVLERSTGEAVRHHLSHPKAQMVARELNATALEAVGSEERA